MRLQNLTGSLSVYASFFGQKASKNLYSSEQLVLAGPQGVRAYPTGGGLGDTGYLLTAELRYGFSVRALPGVMQLVAFVDTGEVKVNENPFAAVPNRVRLSGAGLGVNWEKLNDFSIRLALAQRIGSVPANFSSESPTRIWLQAIKYF